MRVQKFVANLLLAASLLPPIATCQQLEHVPRLLLTPQRLRRLRRDRERDTVRWVNFANRVQSVPDSPERGFELALYYAVSGDEGRGREAVRWAIGHPCETRQVALVLDWASTLVTSQVRQTLERDCADPSSLNSWERERDRVFVAVEQGGDLHSAVESAWKELRPALSDVRSLRARAIYPLSELLIVVQMLEKRDLRESDPSLFTSLPKQYLLSLTPAEVEHPDWLTHVAAFGLVALDSNLESSQFLQGWAMEDRQMLRSGPGVAYEFLWADPYLPGIAYQNMDPWVYDPSGRLFARTGWEPTACWVAIAPGFSLHENCGPSPGRASGDNAEFGNLIAFTLKSKCATLPPRPNKQPLLLWGLKPGQQISFQRDEHHSTLAADVSGMVMMSSDVTGKVCSTRGDRQ